MKFFKKETVKNKREFLKKKKKEKEKRMESTN